MRLWLRHIDPAGAVIPGVEVTLSNDATGLKFNSKTNEVGSYTFANLDPGRYTLGTQMAGFAPVTVTGITVTVAQFARGRAVESGGGERKSGSGGDGRHGGDGASDALFRHQPQPDHA